MPPLDPGTIDAMVKRYKSVAIGNGMVAYPAPDGGYWFMNRPAFKLHVGEEKAEMWSANDETEKCAGITFAVGHNARAVVDLASGDSLLNMFTGLPIAPRAAPEAPSADQRRPVARPDRAAR
jgi:hypothetical protein